MTTRLGKRVSEAPHAILGPIPAHSIGTSLPQRTGRTRVLYGLGIGILTGAATALLIAAEDDGFDPSIYALAGLAFAVPTLVGFILWIALGGWVPRQRMSHKGRQ